MGSEFEETARLTGRLPISGYRSGGDEFESMYVTHLPAFTQILMSPIDEAGRVMFPAPFTCC